MMALNQLIGIGLRHPHYKQVLEDLPSIGWFEVHSENFFANGGINAQLITQVSLNYPLSLHGVGLSLGSASGVSYEHLARLANLIERINPQFVSEHLSWGQVNGIFMPDLLPVPYTQESFQVLKQNILITQDFLKREIFIENPSSYIEYHASEQQEAQFLVELCKATGAKILLDVNNIFVSASNHGWDAKQYIDSIQKGLVKEIHIAGHSTKTLPNNQILRIDTHDSFVCSEVWDLYAYAIERFGSTPTLLEWDAEIPALSVLIDEASKCETYLSSYQKQARQAHA